jgi:predicted RND superfamily exporter protein
MENVILPMSTTTVAAFIGFQAMTLGKFAVLGEFGEIMSFGVTFSFLAAITVVPSVLVLYEIYKPKNLNSPKVVLKRALLLIRGKANN